MKKCVFNTILIYIYIYIYIGFRKKIITKRFTTTSFTIFQSSLYIYIKTAWSFFCLNCLWYFRTKNKTEPRKKVCENKEFSYIAMPSDEIKILEFRIWSITKIWWNIIYYLCISLIKKVNVETKVDLGQILKKAHTEDY